jgi:hypothetical protein
MKLSTTPTGTTTYIDTKGHWAEQYIEAATKANILKGYVDGTFQPDSKISRAEMAAIIARMMNITNYDIINNTFVDINSSYWAYNYILTLSNDGIINGYTDSTFKPFSQITRAEGAALINRAMDKM